MISRKQIINKLLSARYVATGLVILVILCYLKYLGSKITLPALYLTCETSSVESLTLFLAKLIINCEYSQALIVLPDNLLNMLILTTIITMVLSEIARRKMCSLVFTYIGGILLLASLLMLVPLPESVHTQYIQGLVPVLDPSLSVILYGLASGAAILGAFIREPKEVTEVLVSIDELMEPTVPVEERQEREELEEKKESS